MSNPYRNDELMNDLKQPRGPTISVTESGEIIDGYARWTAFKQEKTAKGIGWQPKKPRNRKGKSR